MTLPCQHCSTPFVRRRGRQIYCDDCMYVQMRCVECDQRFEVKRARFNEPNYKGRFCSRACRDAVGRPPVMHGAENPFYNGGLCQDSEGRWRIMCRDGSQMYFYRGVMAAHLGRLLEPHEIVHHINGDPSDDRLENLELTNRVEHINTHRADLQFAQWGKVA